MSLENNYSKKELTFAELLTGLNCCTIFKTCAGCPLYNGPDLGPTEDCTSLLMTAALNCITVLQADLRSAKQQIDQLSSKGN